MSKAFALLSGKGGSGKTTLALSIASMLSNCNLKVLLVDCDLSTNGATYFYEERLSEKSNKISSFYDVFLSNYNAKLNFIEINQYMYFIPSITKITKKNTETYQYIETDLERTKRLNDYLKENYDVIIYDCQAGYTDLLKLILPCVDVSLVVMEADAISSAAIRSFYLKVGDYLDKGKVYQVFNKATEEEYNIYSKISGGTVFTNIETVIFDWKIRKSFSMAQIPDMESTSVEYGEQVFNICKIIFKDEIIQEKIKRYEIILRMHKNEEEEKILRLRINKHYEEHRKTKNKIIKSMYILIMPIFAALVITLFFMLTDQAVLTNGSTDLVITVITLVVSILTIAIAIFFVNDLTKERREQYRELSLDNRNLDSILEEKLKLQNEFDRVEKNRL